MNVRRLLACLVATAALCGCSDRYVQPTDDSFARLSGKSLRQSYHDWEAYAVRVIDRSATGQSTVPNMLGPEFATDTKLDVPPGTHRIVVRVTYSRRPRLAQTLRSGFGEPGEAIVILHAQLEPHGEYQVNGNVDGQFAHVWIEDIKAARPISVRIKCPTRPRNAALPSICSDSRTDSGADSPSAD